MDHDVLAFDALKDDQFKEIAGPIWTDDQPSVGVFTGILCC